MPPRQPPTHNPYGKTYAPPTKGKERARKIRSSYRWQRVRAVTMAQRPLCEGCGLAAQQVHHIKPLHTHPWLAFVDENLSPLCTGCHAMIERGEEVELTRGWGVFDSIGVPTKNGVSDSPTKKGVRGSDEELSKRKYDM